jgi:hypothetical protein
MSTSAREALDNIGRHIARLDEMARNFGPFVRGMGPYGDYWSTRPGKVPAPETATAYIDLCDRTRELCHEVVFVLEYRSAAACTALQTLKGLRQHLHFHPRRESDFRSPIRSLALQARLHEVSNPVAAIRSKMILENPTNDALSLAVSDREVFRIIREVVAETLLFPNNDFASACRDAGKSLEYNSILDFEFRDMHREPPLPSIKPTRKWYQWGRIRPPDTSTSDESCTRVLVVRFLKQ